MISPYKVLNPFSVLSSGLGPELIVNGTFDADTNWTKGSGVTIAGGKATYAAGNGFPGLNQSIPVTLGKTVRFEFDVVDYTSGSLFVTPGPSGTSVTITITGTGHYSTDILWNGSSGNLYIRGDAHSFIGSLDNISCKEI